MAHHKKILDRIIDKDYTLAPCVIWINEESWNIESK